MRALPAARKASPGGGQGREFLRTPLYEGGGERAHDRRRRQAYRRLRSEAIGSALLALLLALLLSPAVSPETARAGAHVASSAGAGGSSAPSAGEPDEADGTGTTPGSGGGSGTTPRSGGGSGPSTDPGIEGGQASGTPVGGVVALLGGRDSSEGVGLPGPGISHIATGIGPLRSKLAHQLSLAGRASSAYVYDITAGRPLFAQRSRQRHAPASVEKLYTATAALMRMGSSARLETRVLSTGHLRAGGVFEGNLYLRGGGDPTFGSRTFIASHYGNVGTSVSTLVAGLKRLGIRRVDGDIEGDDSYFDFLRGDPSSGYAPDIWLEGTLSGLAFNRGQSGSLHGQHALAAYAAKQFAGALKHAGIHVEGRSGAAFAPAGASTLTVARSPRLSVLLHLMLPPSDNFFAETLVKDLGARYGGAGTTKAGIGIVRAEIAELGLRPKIVDGSGLDRADHTSPEQVVKLLQTLAGTYDGAILREDLAVAGRSGTLEGRMKKSFAEGRCEGKTGTLTGVSNLAGYCEAADGHLLAFAFFDDVIPTYTAHVIQDAMAETVADY